MYSSDGGEILRIVISNRDNTPIYEQIKIQVKNAIFSGNLKEGEVLPSIRQLAKDLKVSAITTTRAYNELVEEGFIINVPGKGFYAKSASNEYIREQKIAEIEGYLLKAIDESKLIGLNKDEIKYIFDFLMKDY